MIKNHQAYSHRASGADKEAQADRRPGSLRDKRSIPMLQLSRTVKRIDCINIFDNGLDA